MATRGNRSGKTISAVFDDLVDLENRTWDTVRTRVLTAGAGALAISFVMLQVESARSVTALPWAWILLALSLGTCLVSYAFQLAAANGGQKRIENLVDADGLGTPLARYAENPVRLRWTTKWERGFILLATALTLVGFVLLLVVGFSIAAPAS